MTVGPASRRIASLLLFLGLAAAGPAAAASWARSYSVDSRLQDAAETADGGLLLIGGSPRRVLKLDADGQIEWQRTHGQVVEPLLDVEPTADGGCLILEYDGGLVRLDRAGDVLWHRRYELSGSPPGTVAAHVVLALADGALVGARRQSASDIILRRLDENGELLWQRSYGGDWPNAIRLAADGSFLVHGDDGSSTGILKLDPSGAVIWQTRLRNFGYTAVLGEDLQATADGGGVLTGGVQRNGSLDVAVVRFDASGAVRWQTFLGDPASDDHDQAVTVLPGGEVLVVGGRETGSGPGHAWIAALEPAAGTVLWAKRYLAFGGRFAQARLLPVADGRLRLLGNASDPDGGWWMAMLEADGSVDAGCAFAEDDDLLAATAGDLPVAARNDPVADVPVTVAAGTVVSDHDDAGMTTRCGPAPGCAANLAAPVVLAAGGHACGAPIVTSDTSPLLEWQDVAGESGYRFEVYAAGCTGRPIASGTVPEDVTAATVPALADGEYAVRVVATGDGAAFCDGPARCSCPFTIAATGGCIDDDAEDDDVCADATPACVGCIGLEAHTFCDPDWFWLETRSGAAYEVRTIALTGGADTALTLYAADCTTVLGEDDNGGGGLSSLIRWTAGGDGPVYVEVREAGGRYDGGQGYQLQASCTAGCPSTWVRTWGTAADDRPDRLRRTPGGGSLAIDRSRNRLVRLDPDGRLLAAWDLSHPSEEVRLRDAAATADGATVLAGSVGCFCPGSDDVWIGRLEPDGALAWQHTYGDSSLDSAEGLTATADGGSAIAGTTHRGADYDLLLLKLDSSGNLQWVRSYGSVIGGEAAEDEGRSIAQTADGGFLVGSVITGVRSGTPFGFPIAVVLRLDAAGARVWHTVLSAGPSSEVKVHPTADGGAVAAIGLECVARLDATGAESWHVCHGAANDVLESAATGFVTAGTVLVDGSRDLAVTRLGSDGTVLWRRALGGRDEDLGTGVAETAAGEIVAAATTRSFGAGGTDLWLLQLDSLGRPDFGGLAGSCALWRDLAAAGFPGATRSGVTVAETFLGVTRQSSAVEATAAALSLTEICPAPRRPDEISPGGSPQPLRLAADELTWEPAAWSGSLTFNVYRGSLEALRQGDLGTCLTGGVLESRLADPERPGPGQCFVYHIGGRNRFGDGPLKRGPAGVPAMATSPCP